jgi:rSAM/selenodomain-associated transferase 1
MRTGSGRGTCMLLMVKYPLEGMVKQRLVSSIGDVAATELYRDFVLDLLDTMGTTGIPHIVLFYPPDALQDFRDWLGPDRGFLPQKGEDHRSRLRNGFEDAFQMGFARVIETVSDSPDIPAGYLLEAEAALGAKDAVIGPAIDGGFNVIGFRKEGFLREVFDDVPWSSDATFREVMRNLERAGRSVHTLRPWGDVDSIMDLRRMAAGSPNPLFGRSRTMGFLRGHPDLLGGE